MLFEDGFDHEMISSLAGMGHNVELSPLSGNDRSVFGIGQIIKRDPVSGVLCGGSDPRGDGCAMGY